MYNSSKYVDMKKAVDTNDDDHVDEQEIKQAISILNQARK